MSKDDQETIEIKYKVSDKFEKDVKIEVEILKVQPFADLMDFQYWCKVRAGSWGDMTWFTEKELDDLEQPNKLQPKLGEIWKCECRFYAGDYHKTTKELPFVRVDGGWVDSYTEWADDMEGCPVPICKLEEVD